MFLILLKYLKIYLFIWCIWFAFCKITTIFVLAKEYKINIYDFMMKQINFIENS